jgi:hypothetical protein
MTAEEAHFYELTKNLLDNPPQEESGDSDGKAA